MRSTLIAASALCGLAAAAPRPQEINVAAAEELPLPTVLGAPLAATNTPAVTYDPTAAASSAAAAVSTAPADPSSRRRAMKKRDACQQQPGGFGPVPGDGSVEAYLAEDSILASAAQGASTPSGYINAFTDLQGSTQQIGYLTYKTIDSGDYDVKSCADFCDSEKYCLGFNIYYERDPSVEPADSCANPDPITNVKCALYGYPVASGSATNYGQWRNDFHVVIAGSNGYYKLPTTEPTLPSFNAPEALTAAIDALNEANSYNGMHMSNDGPFDPAVCAAYCLAQTEFDHEHLVDENGNYRPCNFFNAYILTKNDVPQGTYCSFYTQPWDASYAVNTGYSSGADTYKVEASFSYTLTTQDDGTVAQGDSQ
ncbi:hypothetical protein BU26DRAFT_123634 [Trematosphaeria pertusa]|uniref:Apple domain-containing protein n=1 Tax=Trematosphaeria pertusa TaxID=390896 RepID=A0A6A6HY59_9PLEO|nr:uncharacterized protein BU26DRAFT_123634 [Trematosphaeria pertusa]KAF2242981.1 hypothetical protein BU26DRAFT_123634 [Trematosphaeria pertusa]